MIDYTARKLVVGEKVYIEKRYGGWVDEEYIEGVVSKITPTGRIVVSHNDTTTTFNERGHKMGDHYGVVIDWTPLEVRNTMITRRARISKAISATSAILDFAKPRYPLELDSLTTLLDQIRKQLEVAEKLAGMV